MLVLGPLLSNLFVRDMDSRTEHTLSKFGDDTRLCVVKTLEGRDATQREPDRLERWACAKSSSSTRPSVKVLYMGHSNPKHKYSLGGEWIERSPEENELGLLVCFI